MSEHQPSALAQFLPLSVRGISMNDGSISFGSERNRVVIGYITNACSFGDFVTAAMRGRRDFGAPDTAITQMAVADEIVRRVNVHDDLLEALKGLIRFRNWEIAEGGVTPADLVNVWKDAEVAIANAEGRTDG